MKTMEQLFKEWKKRYPDMVSDGIVDDAQYEKLKGKKVLYILREADGDGFDLREGLRNPTPAYGPTWNNVARWQYGLEHADDKDSWNVADNKLSDKRILHHIAAININKAGGESVANLNKIRQCAEEDQALLRRQIELCRPDVIVCCGTGDIVKDLQLAGNLGKWKMKTFKEDGYETAINVGYVVTDKYIVFTMRHPNRAPVWSFRALATAYKQARNEKSYS
jgi:hypothetical protein